MLWKAGLVYRQWIRSFINWKQYLQRLLGRNRGSLSDSHIVDQKKWMRHQLGQKRDYVRNLL